MRLPLLCGHHARACVYRRYEAIAAARQSFDNAWALGRVAQHLANLVDGGVQVVVDIDKGVRPQPLLKFVLGHNVAGVLEQDGQNLKRIEGQLRRSQSAITERNGRLLPPTFASSAASLTPNGS